MANYLTETAKGRGAAGGGGEISFICQVQRVEVVLDPTDCGLMVGGTSWQQRRG